MIDDSAYFFMLLHHNNLIQMIKNNETTVAGKQKTVIIKRALNLPIDTVWKSWTDAEIFRKWWGPKDYTCPTCTIDFKVGGKNHSSMKGPDGKEIWSIGTFREIIPKKKIVYIDSFADKKGNIVSPAYYDMPGDWGRELKVTITLEDLGGKTKMHLEHEGIPREMYDDCVTGWQQSFDKLENNLK
ncbi:SRPBCC domain-containing protein [soil metagenome]